MAEVVNSLFGITPESLTAQRDQALQQEAMQYAKMDPFQRATAGIYAGANRLGGAIGGMLGAQDPAMAQAAQRQSLLQQTRPQDAAGWKTLAQQLWQSKDVQGAQEAFAKAQALEASALEAEKTRSIIAKNTAERTSFSVGDKAFLALAAKATPASVKAAQAADNDISLLEVPEAVKVSTYGQVLKDAGLKEGTPEFQKQMQAFAAAELEGTRKGKGTTLTLPGQPVPQKEWLPFAEYLDKNPLFKKSASLISAAPAALETIRMSTSNDIAAVGFAPMMARMAGEEGALSANDVNRWLKTGGLDDRLIGSGVTFLTGRPTVAKKEQAEKYVTAMFRGSLLEQKRILQDKAKEFGYLESPNYKARLESIDAQLARFKKPSEMKAPGDQPAQAGSYPEEQVNAVLQKYQQPK